VSVLVTLGALGVLAIYWISALPHFDFSRWALNIGVGADGAPVELPEGGGSWLPFGISGALASLPFAVWLFLAIEQLPLAAEESYDPKADMPKGLIYGMSTLMISALLITFLNSGVGSTDPDKMHGAFSLATSAEPLLDGFRVIYGTGTAKLLAFLAVIGLIASFHTIIYAYGRQIYSLSRAGYYLPFMSVTHGTHKVPHMALYSGTVVGFAIMLIVWFVLGSEKGGALIGGTLLNMAVFGAMISYAMQGLSFIRLRQKMPNITRPYRSPLGIPGAAVAIVVALVTIYYQLQDPVYRNGVYGAAIWYVLGMLYFAVIGRHKLVLSPEEEFALTRGEHGHPETEGYGTTKL
jgi:ethanolamine permease